MAQPQVNFDFEGALNEGYSPEEIASFLSQQPSHKPMNIGGAPVGQRREDHGAVACDEIARDVRAERHRGDAVKRPPAARLSHDLREQPA